MFRKTAEVILFIIVFAVLFTALIVAELGDHPQPSQMLSSPPSDAPVQLIEREHFFDANEIIEN